MDLSDEAIARLQARIGNVVLQRYRLDRILGIGGMGAVYSATGADGQRVAIKALHAELSHIPEVRTRFHREAYVGNTIGHPGVARVFEHGVDEAGYALLVLELLEGETLEARWARSAERLAIGEVLAITERLLEVLEAAHARNVIHRDIKPDNIFLTTRGELKVLDFGIARMLDGSGITASGELMGTPAFMPPEQAGGHGKHADPRSDLWSVGAVMFTCLSGRHVHEAPTMMLQLLRAATQPSPGVATVVPDVHPGVAAVIDTALAFDRNARWPSAAAMRARVQALAGIQEPAASPVQSGAVAVRAVAGPTLPLGIMELPDDLRRRR